MKLLSSIKISPLIISLAAVILSGCGSGTESNSASVNSSTTKSTQNATQQIYKMNLYNSLFLTPNKTYSYALINQTNTENGPESSGTFTCNTPSTCVFNLTLTQQNEYLLSISQSQNGTDTLIGGAVVNAPTNTTTYYISIDDVSTSQYLNEFAASKLKNPYDSPIIQSNLFLQALSYEQNVSLNGMLYLYYIYLTETKGQSSNDAISTISTAYQQCEQAGECSIDTNFINNPSVISNAESQLNSTVTNYAHDKNDAQLYETYQQIKSVANTANTVANIAQAPLNALVDGLGSTAVTGIGIISQLIDPVFNHMGLQDSLAAYNRMQAYNQSLTTYFQAAMPNYADIQNQLTATMNSSTLSTAYKDNIINIQVGYDDVINKFASYESVVAFIKSANTNDLTSLVDSAGDGDLGLNNAVTRAHAISYFTNPDNINALATAYSVVYNLDRKKGINNIAERHAYNQNILVLMQNIIRALQNSLYLDQLAITVRDTKYYPKKSFLQNVTIAADVSPLSDLSNPDLATDISAINADYYNKLQQIESNFLSVLVPEKAWVSQSVLQSLEVEGKCNITSTDGEDTLTATCPVYSDGGNGNIATKYITSTLNRQTTGCLLNYGAEQSMMGVSNVRNVNGYVTCEIPYTTGSVASQYDNPNWFNFSNNLDITNMQYRNIGTFGHSGDGFVSWNYSSTLNLAIGDSVGQNKFANPTFNIYSIINDDNQNGTHDYLVSYTESDLYGNVVPRYLEVQYQLGEDVHYTTSAQSSQEYGSLHDNAVVWENEIFANSNYSQQEVNPPLQMSVKLPYPNVLLINNPVMSEVPVTMQTIQTFVESNNISINIPDSANITNIQYHSLFGGTNNALHIEFSYNGINYSRTLLPNGQYNVDQSAGKIVMTNAANWETNPAINPYISSVADTLTSFNLSGSNVVMQCGDITAAQNTLISQGRDEMAEGYSCSSIAWGIHINLPLSTRLYIPVSVNYQGYKSFTIWKKFDYKLRADEYGTDSDSNAFVKTYNLSSNAYDGGYVNVYGYNSFQMDYNSQLGGEDLWFHN